MSVVRFLFMCSVCWCSSCLLSAAEAEIPTTVPDYVMHPRWDASNTLMASVGTTLTFVPRPIAEEEIRQIPMLDANIRWNIASGFSVQSHVGSNYLTNYASIGLQWSTNVGPLSLSIGDDAAVWYGIATMDAFNVDAVGWLNVPHVSLGMSSSELLISLRAEMHLLTSRSTRVGEFEVASDRNQRLGASLALYLEQPFAKKTHLLLGLKLNSLKNAYQSWLAFSTFNDPLLYPELSVGVLL